MSEHIFQVECCAAEVGAGHKGGLSLPPVVTPERSETGMRQLEVDHVSEH